MTDRTCETHFRSTPAAIFTSGANWLVEIPCDLVGTMRVERSDLLREQVQVRLDRTHVQRGEPGGDVQDLVDDH